mgnify:CR=1 FL=1
MFQCAEAGIMFIGRKTELKTLRREFDSDGFRMTVIYGRRRVGKSTLIKEFIRDRRAVYFQAVKVGIAKNIKLFSEAVIEALSPDTPEVMFPDMESILSYLGRKSEAERLIVVIDELPYLSETDPGFLSLLQSYIDNRFLSGKMMLILCGSSVSFMEDEVLSEKSPVYGRRTSQISVMPFDYLESAEFVPSYTYEEKAICYGITGGVAKYLSLLDDSLTLDENIKNLYFSKSGYLYEEPDNLLVQEFRNIRTYGDIISAIAEGRTKIAEIADLTKLDQTAVSHALTSLIRVRIVEKLKALTDEGNKKKTIYRLRDGMFRFWYRFIPAGISYIEMDRGEVYYERFVKPVLHEYMGDIFEDMCRYHTLRMSINGELAINVSQVGKWWGTDPKDQKQTDIDVVGIDKLNRKSVLGESKFKNTPIDKAVLDDLLKRTGLVDKRYKTVQYLLFSLGGFTDRISNHTERKKVVLISLDDMYR